MFNWYVYVIRGDQEIILHDGLTFDQAQSFVAKSAQRVAAFHGISIKEAMEHAGLFINQY